VAPAVALTAIATIACGTAAVTAVFALVSAVLLEPLPYPEANRIVVLVNSLNGGAVRLPYVSPTRSRAWQEQAVGIEQLAVYTLGQAVNLSVSGQARQVAGGHVSASFFPFFGARLARGRVFTADEDRPGRAPVAVLSAALWRGQFGGGDVIGRTISINGELATVVGVLDETFDARSLGPGLVTAPEIWLPLRLDPGSRDDANT
jgi:putative ABC transport system permease protein